MKKWINSAAIIWTFWTSKQEHFLAESLLSAQNCHFNVHVPAWHLSHVHSFQDETEAANDAVFLSTAEKSWKQTGNNSLGIIVNKYDVLFQFWKWSQGDINIFYF